jgi:hypothetical protein
MSIIYQILNAILCIILAKRDANIITEGKYPNHFLNGCIHIAVAFGAGFIFNWWIAIAILFETKTVFDMALNKFRNFSLFRVSPKPTAITDRAEKWLFNTDGITPKIIYLLISFVANHL